MPSFDEGMMAEILIKRISNISDFLTIYIDLVIFRRQLVKIHESLFDKISNRIRFIRLGKILKVTAT